MKILRGDVLIFIIAFLSVVFLIIFIVTATVIGMNMAVIRQKSRNNADTLGEFDKTYKQYIDAGKRWLEGRDAEEQYITSFDGLKLYGRLFRNGNSNTTIIMMHGFRSTAEHDFSLAFEFYFNKGFNLLIPDQRSHGKSEGKFITYGAYESRDVISWAEHINTIFPDGSLYITGVSMGATTVLMAIEQGLPTNVLGIIADCGFTSPAEIIKKVMKKDLKVPLFPFYYTTRAVTKLLTGFDFEEYSAVRAVRESKIPILFLHGKSDGFVPFYMGEEIYSAAACRKKAVWVEGADHGCSFLIDREGCTKALYGFLGI